MVVQQATPTSQVKQEQVQTSPQKSSIKWQQSPNVTAARPWIGSTLEPRKFKPIKGQIRLRKIISCKIFDV